MSQTEEPEKLLTVIIPCYREANTIEEVLTRVEKAPLEPGWQKEIIIVDDGSDAATLQVLRGLEGRAKVVYREKNGGKGAAIKDGLRAGSGKYFLIQDADLELDPAEYRDLLLPIDAGEAQAVFGYRVQSNDISNTALFYGGRMLSLLYNIVFGTNFRDIPCAYKLFPRECVAELLQCPSDDFVFDAVEMTRAISRRLRVAQVAVTYTPRSRAQGKKLFWQQGMYCGFAILFLRLGIHHVPMGKEVPRVLRFVTTGVLSLLVNLAAFFVLLYFGVWYVTASGAAFGISLIFNFAMHKFWTFKSRELRLIPKQLPLHLTLGVVNLGLNTALVYGLVEYVHFWHVGAQVAAAVLIAAESFVLQKRYIFKA